MIIFLLVPVDRSGVPATTFIYNTQHSPFIFEDSPPSYDSLADIKKDSNSATINTNEQIQLTTLPNTTVTDTNEGLTAAAAVLPAGHTLPPPSYINVDKTNK